MSQDVCLGMCARCNSFRSKLHQALHHDHAPISAHCLRCALPQDTNKVCCHCFLVSLTASGPQVLTVCATARKLQDRCLWPFLLAALEMVHAVSTVCVPCCLTMYISYILSCLCCACGTLAQRFQQSCSLPARQIVACTCRPQLPGSLAAPAAHPLSPSAPGLPCTQYSAPLGQSSDD